RRHQVKVKHGRGAVRCRHPCKLVNHELVVVQVVPAGVASVVKAVDLPVQALETVEECEVTAQYQMDAVARPSQCLVQSKSVQGEAPWGFGSKEAQQRADRVGTGGMYTDDRTRRIGFCQT